MDNMMKSVKSMIDGISKQMVNNMNTLSIGVLNKVDNKLREFGDDRIQDNYNEQYYDEQDENDYFQQKKLKQLPLKQQQ